MPAARGSAPLAAGRVIALPTVRKVAPAATTASKVSCTDCRLRPLCLPAGLAPDELDLVDLGLVAAQRRVSRGAMLFRRADRFHCVFVVWTGFFKTVVATRQGRDQVAGFRMAGELLGLDGIGSGRHQSDAVALEDSQVCAIPYDNLLSLARDVPSLHEQFHKLMSREIVSDHGTMLHLGSMHAEERLATFLLDLAERLRRLGYSPSSLLLRMGREELGSFLGLTLETVSRLFSRFQASGLLFVRQRQVQITDPQGLRLLVERLRESAS